MCTKSSADLKSGKSRSCGCLSVEKFKSFITKHGDYKSKEYRAWKAMKNRCRVSPNNNRQKDYYDRGISVCPQWSSYEQFLSDVGRAPESRLTLDRIDNNKGYEPGNVRWASYKEQRQNQRR